MQKPYVIGITGGSGSGKTTLMRRLHEQFDESQVCFLSMDNYYKKREEQATDENNEKNFDLPTSFRVNDFLQDFKNLLSGESVTILEYTFNNPLATAEEITYKPAPVIVVEGIFVFYFKEIAELIDLKIFLEASEHLKLIRRIRRDAEERNYPLEDVLYRYQYHVYPTYAKYIEPMKEQADIVINNNFSFSTGLNLLLPFIKEKVGAPVGKQQSIVQR